MPKIHFNHDIDQSVLDVFDKSIEGMPGHKYKHIEAALITYAVLLDDVKIRLLMVTPGNRDLVLDVLRVLEIPRAKAKRAR